MIALGVYQMFQPRWKAQRLIDQAEKQPGMARFLLDKALALDPSSPEAMRAAAQLHYQQADWDEAASAYEKYLAWVPDDWTAISNQAQAYLNAGRPKEAIERMQMLAQSAPLTDESRASVGAHLAIAFLASGDPAQALEIVKAQPLQRRTLDDGLQQCLFVRAVCQYVLGQRAAAIRDLDRLYATNASFPNVQEIKHEMAIGQYQLEEIGEVHAARVRSSGQDPSASSAELNGGDAEMSAAQSNLTLSQSAPHGENDVGQATTVERPERPRSWQLIDGKWVLAAPSGDEGQQNSH